MGRLKIVSALLVLLFLSVFAALPQSAQASSLIEKFPTSTTEIMAGWNNPTNAYAYDAIYTDATSSGNAEQEYGDFGFNFTTETIEQVYMKIRYYGQGYFISTSDDAIAVYVKLYDGSTWFEWDYLTPYPYIQWESSGEGYTGYFGEIYPSDTVFNVTNRLGTAEKLSALKIRLFSVDAGAGGVDDYAYVDGVSVEVTYSTQIGKSATWFIAGEYILAFSIVLMFLIFIVVIIKKKHR